MASVTYFVVVVFDGAKDSELRLGEAREVAIGRSGETLLTLRDPPAMKIPATQTRRQR